MLDNPRVSEPMIKASYFQGNLDALHAMGDVGASIEAALQPELEATRQASRADWLPMAFDFKLTRLLAEHGGRDAIVDLNKRSFLSAMEGPLLRPIFQGALRLFGVSPRGITRLVQKGWEAGTKDAGTMRAEFRMDGAVIVHSGMVADDDWYVGFEGVLQGIFEATSYLGATTTTVTAGEGDTRTATYDVTWRPR